MKQMIVLKMDMSGSEKLMKKAMKIASGTKGVRSVSVQGQSDQLVVVGEGIDTAMLTLELKKKVCPTSIIMVQAIPQQQQQQSQTHHNEMPQARRCVCDIPNSGFCGFCRSMDQNTYQMLPPQYHRPVLYGGYRDEPDGCIIM